MKTPESPYPDDNLNAPRPRSNVDCVTLGQPDKGYWVQMGPQPVGSTYERQAGGTTWHWMGVAVRLLPADFEMRSRYGRAVDWPLGYADLEPWYRKAEHEIGVSADVKAQDYGGLWFGEGYLALRVPSRKGHFFVPPPAAGAQSASCIHRAWRAVPLPQDTGSGTPLVDPTFPRLEPKMTCHPWTRAVLGAVLILAPFLAGPPAAEAQRPSPAASIDWKAVDAAMGRAGTAMPGGVYRFNMPRSDLAVTARGVRVRPALSLGSWLAFKPTGDQGEAVAMGDLVLTEEEYNRVIARLQQGGVGQTAVHKHLPAHTPALWWTHVHAHGDPVRIAETVAAALDLTGTPARAPAPAAAAPLELDTAGIRQALGQAGQVNGGVYQVSVPRTETIRSMGIEVPPSMGMATVLNFQPTGGGRAAINGDYVMTAGEVDAVIGALRQNGIEIVELHNHLTDEEPRLFFVHFWANDDAVKLARGLRAALDRTGSRRER